jgi:activator of HSP90 ATPase
LHCGILGIQHGGKCDKFRGVIKGGAVSCYGGYISAINIELNPGKTIVQAWRTQGWPAGHWSILRLVLKAAKGGKTKVTMTHDAVPKRKVNDIAKGWHFAYWTPMKKYFAK